MSASSQHGGSSRRRYALEILLVSFAALLLEISYTRVISFKLFYYYTYLVIGLALLGIGCGGVIVAISRRLRRAETETILQWGMLLGAASVAVGAFMPPGLGTVAGITRHPREYVAWSWAVNGFASVIGAVLTTILAMALGFSVVLVLALVVYGIAVLALRGLLRATPAAVRDGGAEVPVPGALTGAAQEAPVAGA